MVKGVYTIASPCHNVLFQQSVFKVLSYECAVHVALRATCTAHSYERILVIQKSFACPCFVALSATKHGQANDFCITRILSYECAVHVARSATCTAHSYERTLNTLC